MRRRSHSYAHLLGGLTALRRFGRGFSRPNLIRARQMFLAFPPDKIRSTVSNELQSGRSTRKKGDDVAHYALENLPSKVLAREYRLTLPDEKELTRELSHTRALLEKRSGPLAT